MKKVNTVAKNTLRWVITFGGIVAVSGFQTCTAAYANINTPKTTNSPIIRPSLQLYVEPPHCSARSNDTSPGRKNTMPMGSSRLTCVMKLAGSCFWGGGFQRNSMTTIVTAPMGRLIQKHHRQLTPPVNPPPTRGPRTEDKPKTMPKRP